jgi:S-formylglutathione hydrolase FrmB
MEPVLSWKKAARWDGNGRLIKPSPAAPARLFTHSSRHRKKDVNYFAFVPEGGAPDDRYPVVYLLHGAYDGYTAWHEHAAQKLSRLAATFGVIIITPDGDPFGWYLDSPVDETSQIESYFFEELIPHVEGESGLPVLIGGEHRAIGGLSMGGHGALTLALKHPGAFVSTSSMSGILDITTHPKSWEIRNRLGSLSDQSRALWERHSATHLLRHSPPGLGELRLLFTATTEDKAAYAENAALKRELESRGVDFEYAEESGGHSWKYWTSIIDSHIAFHAKWLSGDGQGE